VGHSRTRTSRNKGEREPLTIRENTGQGESQVGEKKRLPAGRFRSKMRLEGLILKSVHQIIRAQTKKREGMKLSGSGGISNGNARLKIGNSTKLLPFKSSRPYRQPTALGKE